MSKDKAEYGQRNKNARDTSKTREQSIDRKIVNERKGVKRTDSISKDIKSKDTLKRTNSIHNDIKKNTSKTYRSILDSSRTKDSKITPSSSRLSETKPKLESSRTKESKITPSTSRLSETKPKIESSRTKESKITPSTSRLSETKPKIESSRTKDSIITPSTVRVSETKPKLESSRTKEPKSSTRTTTDIHRLNSKTEILKRTSSNASKPNVALKKTSKDGVSNRVTSEKYFPKKYPFSSHLHEGENTPKQKVQNEQDNKEIIESDNSQIESAKPRPKLQRERTLTRILSPDEVKVVQEIVKNKDRVERPRTATIRKGQLEQRNDSVNDSSEMTDSLSNASTVLNMELNDRKSRKSVETQKIITQDTKNSGNKINEESKYGRILKNAKKTNLETSKTEVKEPNILSDTIEQSAKNSIKNSTESLHELSSKSNILPSTSKHTDSEISDTSLNEDYEDDFDSYESDFEEYISKSESSSPSDINTDTSSSESEDHIEMTQKRINSAETDEEKKLDSGTYDLPELKHKQVLDNIKEAIEKENLNLNKKIETVSNLASLSDEGFDEKFSLNNGFINFDLKKRQKKSKNKRGEHLMNMIRLDAVSYSLFDQKAISYDEFMQSYGRSGTVQVSAQTGDDNVNEEVQTEEIIYKNKWTQYPVRLPNTQNISYNHLGVGEDPPVELEKEYQPDNTKKLENFLQTTGQLMSALLERKSDVKQNTYNNDNKIPFSEGYFKLNIEEYPFLNGRSVTYVGFSESSTLLTVHKSNTEVYMNADEQLLSRSCVCVWNLLEPTRPEKILVSSGEINKACFDNKHSYLVFAGIQDGAVGVWDLRESSNVHRKVFEDRLDQSFTMRCPTYTTTATQNTDSNSCEIIAIKCLNTNSVDNINNNQDIISLQICTLDEIGVVTIWSVIQRQNPSTGVTEDQGLVPWGTVVLVQGMTMTIQDLNPELKELQCFDLQCSDMDSNHLYVATNYGVLHCLTSGKKPKPKIYSAETDAVKSVSCIEMCPFSSSHFLAGSNRGNVRLHSRRYERALMNLRSAEEDDSSEERVEIIQWSKSRPCVFYVKDSTNYVHVWDFLSSDMYPIYSIPFRDEITSIKLSPLQKGNHSYMAIASKRGSVYLHTINDKFGQRSSEQFTVELQTFLNYVNRL